MIRKILSSAIQKKFFLMFFTSVIYIVGLCAYFADSVVLVAFLVTVLGVFAIAKNYLSPKLVLFWYFMFFFGFFNASLRIKNSDILYQIAPQSATIEGQIVSIPTNANKEKTKFFVDVSKIDYNYKSENIHAKILVSVFNKGKSVQKFNIGDTYRLKGKLRDPFEASNPSQFDYGKYLRNFGVFTLFYANESDCQIKPQKLTPRWQFLQWLNNVRNDIITTHSQYLKSPNLELLGGIVFGDDAIAPPDEIKTSFQHSGLLHLLAASGMNVALIYGIWFFILRRLRVPFNLTVSSGIFVIIFYALMTGLGASVIRATFMLIFILLGKLIDRDAHSVSLLSFVALIMLIYNPAFINDVGFQLSFMVTFGLLVTAPVVFERVKSMPNWLSGAIFVPVIAQIWVAPIQMYYFNSFSLYLIFANIASLPFVTVISFGGFLSAVLALIKPIADKVCFLFDLVLNPVLNVLVSISDYFAKLPHSLVQMPQPSVSQIFLYYSILLLATFLFKADEDDDESSPLAGEGEISKRGKSFRNFGEGFGQRKSLVLVVAILSLVLVFSCIKFPSHNLETIAFDVQNADAFLIKTPQDKYFLIDSGKMSYNGGKTQARMFILEYLKDHGIKNIEGLVITHFDSDHAGGAVDLIENLNIKNIYVNSLDDNSRLAKMIYRSAKNKLRIVGNNEIIYEESLGLPRRAKALLAMTYHNRFSSLASLREVLFARRRSNPKNDTTFIIKTFVAGLKGKELENENSVITLVSDNDFDELFMGDAGIVSFEKIKKDLPKQVEVLKVGHHGAKNVVNKAFLDRINPEVAIISTGINNYGHPNGVTLDILKSHKVRVFRTDRQNSIRIDEKPDGKYDVSSYLNGKYISNIVTIF